VILTYQVSTGFGDSVHFLTDRRRWRRPLQGPPRPRYPRRLLLRPWGSAGGPQPHGIECRTPRRAAATRPSKASRSPRDHSGSRMLAPTPAKGRGRGRAAEQGEPAPTPEPPLLGGQAGGQADATSGKNRRSPAKPAPDQAPPQQPQRPAGSKPPLALGSARDGYSVPRGAATPQGPPQARQPTSRGRLGGTHQGGHASNSTELRAPPVPGKRHPKLSRRRRAGTTLGTSRPRRPIGAATQPHRVRSPATNHWWPRRNSLSSARPMTPTGIWGGISPPQPAPHSGGQVRRAWDQ